MKLAAACTSIKVKAKPARGGKRTRASGDGAVPMEKKESEKERRQRMKALCGKLASLVPKELNPHADTMTKLGSLDVAASYIKKLKERVDELQHKKTSAQAKATLLGGSGISTPTITATTSSGAGTPEGGKHLEPSSLVVEVRQSDDASMEVRLICSTERPIKLHEVITILEEEGAVIINANHSVAAHKIFCTIHSRAFSTRIGIDVSRISKRLGALIRRLISPRLAPPSVHNSCCCCRWCINKLQSHLPPPTQPPAQSIHPHLPQHPFLLPPSINPPLHHLIKPNRSTSSLRLRLRLRDTNRSSTSTSTQHTNEEQEADRPGGGREAPHHKQRLRRQQDGAQGRGEEPAAAHEGTLPQALLPPPGLLIRPPPPPLLHFFLFLFLAAVQQQGRGDAAGSAGQRGGVHQAAQGPDRRPQAPQAGRPRRRLLILRLRRRLQGSADDGSAAGDRGAVPGRVDAGRGAGERGGASVPAARGDRGAGAGGRGGGQRQLLRRRGQDLLHGAFPGALPPHRPRRRPRRPPAPRPRRSRRRLVVTSPDMICLSFLPMAT